MHGGGCLRQQIRIVLSVAGLRPAGSRGRLPLRNSYDGELDSCRAITS